MRTIPGRAPGGHCNAPASTLDPAHLIRGLGTKVIIDATTPVYPDIPMADNISVEVPADADYWIGEIQRRMQVVRGTARRFVRDATRSMRRRSSTRLNPARGKSTAARAVSSYGAAPRRTG